jgi:AAA15 family ATPase/GTPase
MLKRSITYTDFDDEEVTEEFYFNLSKTEIIAMETKKKGGFSAWIQEMVKIEDTPVLMKEFETFILMTYGEKSPDGKRFVKTDEIQNQFKYSAAYDVLFWELFTDEEKMADFVAGVMPKEAQEKAREEIAKQKATTEISPPTAPPIPPQL